MCVIFNLDNIFCLSALFLLNIFVLCMNVLIEGYYHEILNMIPELASLC